MYPFVLVGLRLKHLSENKLIIKKENWDEKTYALSEKGRTLIAILEQLTQWRAKH